MTVPYSSDAEECVIGSCLISSYAVETAIGLLTPGDFYVPSNQRYFIAILELYKGGYSVDAVTVLDELKKLGSYSEGDAAELMAMQSNTPTASSLRRYANIVGEQALRRNAIAIGTELVAAAQDPTIEIGKRLDGIVSDIKGIDSPAMARPPDDVTFEEFIARPPESRTPWAVQGLLREDWRLIVVASEGIGKSCLLTQTAVCSSYGIHPLNVASSIPPARVLLVDLENPTDVVHDRIEDYSRQCRYQSHAMTEEHNAFLWHRPGGIDLRKRSSRGEFEDVLKRRRPNFVVFGPMYKAYTRNGHESDEQVAAEVQNVLDDLRTRYGFAIMIEHHAPKGIHGSRELVPFGSSLWLRWSDLGFSLVPPNNKFPAKELTIESYRGDRVMHGWPHKIQWGKGLPWVGVWDKDVEEDF